MRPIHCSLLRGLKRFDGWVFVFLSAPSSLPFTWHMTAHWLSVLCLGTLLLLHAACRPMLPPNFVHTSLHDHVLHPKVHHYAPILSPPPCPLYVALLCMQSRPGRSCRGVVYNMLLGCFGA